MKGVADSSQGHGLVNPRPPPSLSTVSPRTFAPRAPRPKSQNYTNLGVVWVFSLEKHRGEGVAALTALAPSGVRPFCSVCSPLRPPAPPKPTSL